MYNNAETILTEAFNTQSLAALHIDLQKDFYYGTPRSQRDEVFGNAAKLSRQLRHIGVPNIWVAYTDEYADTLRHKDYHPTSDRERFHIVEPDENDIILPKDCNGLCDSSIREFDPLDHLPDTVIATGVHFNICFADTLAGLFSACYSSSPLRVIVAHDATDLAPHASIHTQITELRDSMRSYVGHDFSFSQHAHYKFTHARSDEIIEHLHRIASQSSPTRPYKASELRV